MNGRDEGTLDGDGVFGAGPSGTQAIAGFLAIVGLLVAAPQALATGSPASQGDEGRYVGHFEVHLEKTNATAGPQEAITFPITIESYANNQTRFEFEAAGEGGDAKGFQIVPPAPLVIPAASGDEPRTATAKLTLYTPFENGYVSETVDVRITISSRHASDPSLEGESKQVTVTANAQGFHIPGPGAVGAVAVLAGTTLLARRRGR